MKHLRLLILWLSGIGVGIGSHDLIFGHNHEQTKPTTVDPIIGYTVLNADSVIMSNGDTVALDHRVHKRIKK